MVTLAWYHHIPTEMHIDIISDSVWPLLSGLILAPVVSEFQFQGPFLSLAINVGLFVGAVFWGLGCDIWGRRFVPDRV